MANKESSKPRYSEMELRKTRMEIVSMSLSDNVFFVNVMKNVKLFSHILSVLLGEEMEVIGEIKEVETDCKLDFSLIGRRSARLDALARDSKGNLCHIEMENVPARMTARRGRFYSSASDVYSLMPGEDYEMLKKSFHLFFVDGDAVGNGKIVNIFSRKNQWGEEYDDGSYIYVINVNALSDDALGRLLRSIKEPDPEKIEDKVVQEVITFAKGDVDMEISIHDTKIRFSKEREEALFQEGVRKGIEKGIEEGIEKEKSSIAIEAMKLGLSRDVIMSLTRLSSEELDMVLEGKEEF